MDAEGDAETVDLEVLERIPQAGASSGPSMDRASLVAQVVGGMSSGLGHTVTAKPPTPPAALAPEVRRLLTGLRADMLKTLESEVARAQTALDGLLEHVSLQLVEARAEADKLRKESDRLRQENDTYARKMAVVKEMQERLAED